MIQKLSYLDWNNINDKDDEVDVVLKECDIVYKINNLYCACETTNECNNILVFSDVRDIGNIKSMLYFVYILGTTENIKCITVNSKINRYRIFKDIFKKYGAFPPPQDNRDEFYFLLDDDCLSFIKSFIDK